MAFQEQRSSLARATCYANSAGHNQRRPEHATKAAKHARTGAALSYSCEHRQCCLSRAAPKWLGRVSQRQRGLCSRVLGGSEERRRLRSGSTDREILSDDARERTFAARSAITLEPLADASAAGSFSSART